jgi:8-oxo-dGTP pyrophosphatase MutT (NUDIX family)
MLISKEKNFRLRPFCAVYLILVNEKNQVLLLRRYNTGYKDGFYSLPAGHIEKNETPTVAVCRETLEEINIQPLDLKFVNSMYRLPENIEERTYVEFFFAAKKYSGKIQNLEPNKCDNLDWFDLDKLPKNIIPYIDKALRNYKNLIYFSET